VRTRPPLDLSLPLPLRPPPPPPAPPPTHTRAHTRTCAHNIHTRAHAHHARTHTPRFQLMHPGWGQLSAVFVGRLAKQRQTTFGCLSILRADHVEVTASRPRLAGGSFSFFSHFGGPGSFFRKERGSRTKNTGRGKKRGKKWGTHSCVFPSSWRCGGAFRFRNAATRTYRARCRLLRDILFPRTNAFSCTCSPPRPLLHPA
jgi:hypothetical protein